VIARVVLDARTATDHFPGIGRYAVNLARALIQVAPDLELSLLQDPSAPASRLALPELPRITCPVSPFALRQQWAVPRILRQSRADVYHSAYYLMPYLPGVPTVLTYYDLIPIRYPHYFSRWQPLIYRLATVLALRTAGLTLAISESTRTDLIRYFHADPERLAVTPLAADERMRPAAPEQINAVRWKHHLPEQYVLYLGVNKPHKNLVKLVEAWSHFKSRNPHSTVQLVIAGHWDERYPEAKRLCEELGLREAVAFAGPVAEADLPALYSGAMLFVFPSLYEGFGLPVLEAMACGTPVICSSTSSLPEVAGNAAVLIDPANVEALAEALQSVLDDDERRRLLRARGLAQADRFSWRETARRTAEAYRSLSHSVDVHGA
jgi:glycosyltransferase involved in cell wall biosynthesis